MSQAEQRDERGNTNGWQDIESREDEGRAQGKDIGQRWLRPGQRAIM